VHERHPKRAPSLPYKTFLKPNEVEGLRLTYSGWWPEPGNSDWNRDTIADFAEATYLHLVEDIGITEPYVVAALRIKGKGVALGTQVRGFGNTDRTAELRMEQLLPVDAPVLWQYVSLRTKTGVFTPNPNTAKWHAEDTAM
jgi:hypothetical protein